MSTLITVGSAPCGSCPYRRDVPSGVWHETEYEKLPGYDGEMVEQAMAGRIAAFYCHQQDGRLCSGWVGCHGAENLLALRLMGGRVDPAVWDFQSPVPLFSSGAEACAHGKQEIEQPPPAALRVIDKLSRRQGQ